VEFRGGPAAVRRKRKAVRRSGDPVRRARPALARTAVFGPISDACPPGDINLWCESARRRGHKVSRAAVVGNSGIAWAPAEPTRAHEPATQVITNARPSRVGWGCPKLGIYPTFCHLTKTSPFYTTARAPKRSLVALPIAKTDIPPPKFAIATSPRSRRQLKSQKKSKPQDFSVRIVFLSPPCSCAHVRKTKNANNPSWPELLRPIHDANRAQ
jgi:hypothetical protein